MLSIIIPTLNEEQCIESVVTELKDQIKEGDEIIIVDAQSTDRTVEIAERLNVKILEQPKNGNGLARTAGAAIAENDYIMFIDADTLIPSGYLDRARKHVEKKPLAVGGLDLYTSDSRIWKWIYDTYSRIIFLLAVLNHKITKECWVPSNNCIFHRKTFLESGGYRSVICEDADLMRRFPKTDRMIYDDKFIVSLSDRRFKSNGFFRTVALWTWGNIKLIIGGQVGSENYKKGY